MISEHLTEYDGLPVTVFDPKAGPGTAGLPAPDETAWTVRLVEDWDDSIDPEFLDRFTAAVDGTRVTHLIIGNWGNLGKDDPTPVSVLTAVADRLPNLRALFFGDIVLEEQEISWIEHSDITPLFNAFPTLERLDVRGGQGLEMKPVRHERLRTLRFESGGLPGGVVRAVAASDLPALDRLELWLGTSNYGGDATVEDLAPILSGERLPSLRCLGLEDSEIEDEIATAVAGAPVVARLESLSLGMGTLTDRGVEALLSGQPLTHLAFLGLNHAYLTKETRERVQAALPGVRIDLSDGQDPADDWPYVAVAE
ncbi:STM4015 family protein [Actinomadura viridis]|uniref:Leucine rich repeat (LRR) protein n=1 Tax=Actinomadura viridis TaxID=58110 RepID=A0A931DMB4_9ACTN|nr:STM4015 family protein [Actinomadura viridis]MBG6091284.1 hypothetical protein [Actinomadura viridis]